MRLHVIACPVFQRELELLSRDTANEVTFRPVEGVVHECPTQALQSALQSAIDQAAPSDCDAIAIAYGLCNKGLIGLRARHVPVVIPRAHDCLGMLLGGGRRYLEQLQQKPGTYFQSAGWLSNAPGPDKERPSSMTFGPASNITREQLVERYGEENADYLLEQFADFTAHYERLVFIDTPLPDRARWAGEARRLAAQQGWTFESVAGDLGWLGRLLNAEWDEREFLVLQPGQSVVRVGDDRLMEGEPA